MKASIKLGLRILISMAVIQPTAVISSEFLDQNTIGEVEQFLSDSVKNGFSGTVLIAENGIKKINSSYGYADRGKGIRNQPLTVFDLGSNTKQFTGAAIMLLQQTGRLSLTDPISMYFDDLPEDKKMITIHHLLIHTSGLPEAVGKDFDPISESDFFHQVFHSQLLFPVGSQHGYSNIGYSVLAKIIERISGQSYEAFLHQHLFIPSGMQDTGYLIPTWKQNHLAKGYAMGVADQGSMVSRYQQEQGVNWHLIGNGGINSTQEDMLLWIGALKNNTILSHRSFELLTTGYSTIFAGFDYGYGWAVNQSLINSKRLSHNGSNGSFAHNIIWLPEDGVLILFATNAASPQTERMAKTIEKIIFQPEFVAEPIRKNPYFLVNEFIQHHDHKQANALFTQIKNDRFEDFASPKILNRMGYQLLKNQQTLWAIELFKMNSVLFSQNGQVWDSLGEAYAADQQTTLANQSFTKAIALGHTDSVHKMIKN